MQRALLISICVATFVVSAPGADVTPSAAERFADLSEAEAPDFQRHVIPLISSSGCSARDCHGSFQGKGGFRLSLFGYDFAADHEAITRNIGNSDQPRIDLGSPKESLLLKKPTRAVAHEGGKKIDPDSWQYALLRRWIESGAKGVKEKSRLARLEVQPAEITFDQVSAPVPLRVIAHWEDGTSEDVTCLSRFQINDEAVASVGESGSVGRNGPGDTHAVVFYDNGVAAVPVLAPLAERATIDYAVYSSGSKIDEAVNAKLNKLGIVPSERCTDTEFLRRVSIDITGTLPSPNEVDAFVRDPSPDRRAMKIEELLDRPAYAAWWATKLSDFTGNSANRQAEMGQETASQWYDWLYKRITDNMPYDALVAGIVLAQGRTNDQTYADYATEMASYFSDEENRTFASRETMPHFWTRESVKKPEEKALSFAHSFLGVRLHCAQCHKHPFDRWTKQDFDAFANFFKPVRYGVAPTSKESYRQIAKRAGAKMRGDEGVRISKQLLAKVDDGMTIPFRELYIESNASPVELRLLGERVAHISPGEDPRKPLMQWLREPDNPYFARVFVNRVWSNYFHRGIIEPTDDLNPANPPCNRNLLDYLTIAFIESGYDMKALHREITNSHTYQRSWRPNETNQEDRRNFSHAIPRRLPAEVVYDGLAQITAADSRQVAVRTDQSRRAVGHLAMRMAGTYAMDVFGKPARSTNCDCERSTDTSLLQSIFLQNDPLLRMRLDESDWLKELGELSSRDCVRQAYLRALGRPPSDSEAERALRHLAESETKEAGMRDLLWALINSKEFLLNH